VAFLISFFIFPLWFDFCGNERRTALVFVLKFPAGETTLRIA
jgi:hypothetical protein